MLLWLVCLWQNEIDASIKLDGAEGWLSIETVEISNVCHKLVSTIPPLPPLVDNIAIEFAEWILFELFSLKRHLIRISIALANAPIFIASPNTNKSKLCELHVSLNDAVVESRIYFSAFRRSRRLPPACTAASMLSSFNLEISKSIFTLPSAQPFFSIDDDKIFESIKSKALAYIKILQYLCCAVCRL